MTDIPIIFSAPMVLALLREVDEPGTGKTRTRRLAWTPYKAKVGAGAVPENVVIVDSFAQRPSPWQKVKPGDRLWVKENFWRYGRWIGTKHGGDVRYSFQPLPWAGQDAFSMPGIPANLAYAAGEDVTHHALRGKFADAKPAWHLRPNIFLERAHSRLTLIITSTRIERLHDIDEQDCESEGLRWKDGLWRCPAPDGGDWHATEKAIGCWRWLWTKLHGEESWHENPEVVVLGFSVHKVNIDAMKVAA